MSKETTTNTVITAASSASSASSSSSLSSSSLSTPTKSFPPFIDIDDAGQPFVHPVRLSEYVRQRFNCQLVMENKSLAYYNLYNTHPKPYLYNYNDDSNSGSGQGGQVGQDGQASTRGGVHGVYRYYNKEALARLMVKIVSDYDPYLVKMRTINEAVRLLSISERTISYDAFNRHENLINVKNGILDLKTMKIMPHTPKFLSTIQVDAEFIEEVATPEEAATPEFDKFLKALLAQQPKQPKQSTGADITTSAIDTAEEAEAAEAEAEMLILAYMGACFSNIPGHYFRKALFLSGPTKNAKNATSSRIGRNVLIRLIASILGKSNTHNTHNNRYIYNAIELPIHKIPIGKIHHKRLAYSLDIDFSKESLKNGGKNIDFSNFRHLTGGNHVMDTHGETFMHDGMFIYSIINGSLDINGSLGNNDSLDSGQLYGSPNSLIGSLISSTDSANKAGLALIPETIANRAIVVNCAGAGLPDFYGSLYGSLYGLHSTDLHSTDPYGEFIDELALLNILLRERNGIFSKAVRTLVNVVKAITDDNINNYRFPGA